MEPPWQDERLKAMVQHLPAAADTILTLLDAWLCVLSNACEQAAENGAALGEQGERLEAMAQRASAATDTILTLQEELRKAQHADAAQRDKVSEHSPLTAGAAHHWQRIVRLQRGGCCGFELVSLAQCLTGCH